MATAALWRIKFLEEEAKKHFNSRFAIYHDEAGWHVYMGLPEEFIPKYIDLPPKKTFPQTLPGAIARWYNNYRKISK